MHVGVLCTLGGSKHIVTGVVLFQQPLNQGQGPVYKDTQEVLLVIQSLLIPLAIAPVTWGHQSSCFMTLMLSALKSHPCCLSVKLSGHKHFFV